MKIFKRFKNTFYREPIEDGLYMKILEKGYNANSDGIIFNDIVTDLNVDLKNQHFELNFVIWYYSNFYHQKFEKKIIGLSTTNPEARTYYLNDHTYKDLKQYNSEKSFIKGDALNTYINFLELKRTRKESRIATRFSIVSIIIAIISLFRDEFVNLVKYLLNTI